ncbi:MAG: hypothetical protein AAGF11_53190 [Myxococcota bacterium]
MGTYPIHAIDPALYVRLPRLGVDSALSLAKTLLTLRPKKPPRAVIEAAKALAAPIDELEVQARAQGRVQPVRDPRPADLRLDRAWGVVEERLRSWAILSAQAPDAQRAAELLAWLFPTGRDFLTLPYPQQHAQSERRVQIIEQEGLRDSLDALVGELFVQELLDAHADYGVALGITVTVEPAAPPVSVAEPLEALLGAISRYVLQVIAFADQHPDNVAPAQRALAPIDAYRRAAARRSNARATTAEEPAPIEVMPDAERAVDAPTPSEPTPSEPTPSVPTSRGRLGV